MKDQSRMKTSWAMAGCTILGGVLASSQALAQSQTAQSVMIDIDMPAGFVIEQSETWAFDSELGKTYYTNAWDGLNPTVTCTKVGGQGCTSTPTPGVTLGCNLPKITDRMVGKREDQAIAEKCTFYNGGELVGTTYAKKLNCNYNTGTDRGNWAFTYTFLVAPINPDVAAKTAWDLIDSSGSDTVLVDVGALIASQAALNNEGKGKKAWTRKYDFSLAGSEGGSRVGPLTVVLERDPSGVDQWVHEDVDHELDTNPVASSDDPDNFDFYYRGNAGENPSLSPLLVPEGSVVGILQGSVRARDGKGDDFHGNDQVVGKVDLAHMDPVMFEIGEGDYNVKVSGVVRGISAVADTPFGASFNLDIDAEECTP